MYLSFLKILHMLWQMPRLVPRSMCRYSSIRSRQHRWICLSKLPA